MENDIKIAGESLDDLARALRNVKSTTRPNGSVHIRLRMERNVAPPLLRAVMRIESELLLEDADRLSGDSACDTRTPEQRGADAFVELARRYAGAAGG